MQAKAVISKGPPLLLTLIYAGELNHDGDTFKLIRTNWNNQDASFRDLQLAGAERDGSSSTAKGDFSAENSRVLMCVSTLLCIMFCERRCYLHLFFLPRILFTFSPPSFCGVLFIPCRTRTRKAMKDALALCKAAKNDFILKRESNDKASSHDAFCEAILMPKKSTSVRNDDNYIFTSYHDGDLSKLLPISDLLILQRPKSDIWRRTPAEDKALQDGFTPVAMNKDVISAMILEDVGSCAPSHSLWPGAARLTAIVPPPLSTHFLFAPLQVVRSGLRG